MSARSTFTLAPLLCAALASTAPPPARADVHARLQLSNFGYSLVDLAPDDGVAPAVELFPERTATLSRVYSLERALGPDGLPLPDWSSVVDHGAETGFFSPISRTVSQTSSGSSLALTGRVEDKSFATRLDSWAANGRGDGLADNSSSAIAQPAWDNEDTPDAHYSIVVAPHTALVWSGQLTMEVERGPRGVIGRHERAWSTAWFRLADSHYDDIDNWYASMDTKDRPPGLAHRDEQVQLTFANATDSVARGQLFIFLDTIAATSVEAVPEPGTAALLLCGLGVVASAARRGARSPRQAA